jgi:DNA-binding response OmpR family regulator
LCRITASSLKLFNLLRP